MIRPPVGWTVADLPAVGPATVPDVKAHLSIADATDDAAITDAVDAVNAMVRKLPASYGVTGLVPWDDDVTHGAVMLAARLFRRRNSPEGVAAFNDTGAVYVSRTDPDVAALLRIGSHTPPAVG